MTTSTITRSADNRVKCYRTNGTCYAVVSPSQWRDLREHGRLDAWLDEQRESGVVIDLN